MRSTKSAIRYAKAILELSSESNSVDLVAVDMERIVEAGNESGEFQIFLNSPIIKTDKKISILKVLFPEFTELTSSFVELITKNKREYLLYVNHFFILSLIFSCDSSAFFTIEYNVCNLPYLRTASFASPIS